MALKRRTLLTGAVAAAAGAAAGAGLVTTRAVPVLGGGSGMPLPFKLYTVGEAGDMLPQEDETLGLPHPETGLKSVVIEVDMQTRQARYMPYTMPSGHWPLVLPDGRVFITSRSDNKATFMAPDGQVLKAFTLERFDGLVFGGHSLYDPASGRIFSSAANNLDDGYMTGFLIVTDATTMEITQLVPISGTNHSHELRFLPGGTELVVSGYAITGGYEADVPVMEAGWSMQSVQRSMISVLDVATLAVKRQFLSPNPYIMGHMDVDAQGNVYLEQLRKITYKTPREEDGSAQKMSMEKMAELVQGYHAEIGGTRTWPLHMSERMSRDGLSTPMGIMRINAYTGEVSELWEHRHNHRYVQSLAYHPHTDSMYVTARHSDALLVFPAGGGKPYSRPTAEFGIYSACGVCAIPGTPYIALLSNVSGIAIVDTDTLHTVDYYPVATYSAIHINAVAKRA
jgi:hypothetical protein